MKIFTKIKIAKAKRDADKEIGYKIDKTTAKEVLEYCKRKLIYIKKDEGYLPLLYRFELPLQVSILAINKYSEAMMKQRKEGGKVVC